MNHDNILNESKSFKKELVDAKSKRQIAGKEASKNITNDSSGFTDNILKDRISSLESELKSKDVII